MFRNTAPAAEAPPQAEDVIAPAADLIAVSVLALDLSEPPVGGWVAYLTGRGIPIVLDHIGRSAISCADARQLLDERREDEFRKQELVKRQEAAAVEADQRFRAQLTAGLAIPAGMTPAEAIREAILAEQAYTGPKRRTPLEDALDGGGMTFHPIRIEPGGEL